MDAYVIEIPSQWNFISTAMEFKLHCDVFFSVSQYNNDILIIKLLQQNHL